jgi:hypothetical protein
VVAPAAIAGPITKGQAQRAAKNVTIKKAKKSGLALHRRDIKASCHMVQGQVNTWRCRVNVNSGQCKGSMTIYEVPTKGYRAKRVRLACAG